MSSLNESIKFYLNIEDPNIIFSNYLKKWINGKYHNLYLAELIQTHCPYLTLSIMAIILLTYALLLLMLAIIRLKKQRVLCNACLKRSMAQSNLINKGCYISNTSKRKILSALIEDRSMTSIAREYNVSVNTVQRVLESCSSNFYDDYDHLPKHLAFDEFRGVVKKLHFICLDGLDCDQTLDWVMQDFMVAIQNNDEKKVIHLLHSKQMHQNLLTFKRNYSGVLNGITYSNGFLEGTNRKIKQIERTAYGYANFNHLVTRIKLEEKDAIIKEKASDYYLVA